jgi:hypothetical protein
MRLDIDSMMHWGAIQPGFHLGGEMRLHQLYGSDIDVKFESPTNSRAPLPTVQQRPS